LRMLRRRAPTRRRRRQCLMSDGMPGIDIRNDEARAFIGGLFFYLNSRIFNHTNNMD
jgi:hypothetical protein